MLNRHRLAQVASLVGLIVVWWLVSIAVQVFRVVQHTSGANLIPTPADVLPKLIDLIVSGQFIGPLAESVTRTAVGFAAGFIVGVSVGIASVKLRGFSVSTAPLLNVILFAPTIGTHIVAIAVITTLVVAPNIAIYMRDVLRDFDQEILDMADSFRVSQWRRITDLYLPYLVPPMLASARIGFSMSWKVVLLSEVFGFPGGLGYQIRSAYTIFDLSLLISWLAIFVVALLVIEQFIRIAESRIVRWQT
jgi:NitT/TauT family transport system permease protein